MGSDVFRDNNRGTCVGAGLPHNLLQYSTHSIEQVCLGEELSPGKGGWAHP